MPNLAGNVRIDLAKLERLIFAVEINEEKGIAVPSKLIKLSEPQGMRLQLGKVKSNEQEVSF